MDFAGDLLLNSSGGNNNEMKSLMSCSGNCDSRLLWFINLSPIHFLTSLEAG